MAAEARERDLGFLFIGDGPVKGEVLEAARASGVEDRTVFTGMVPLAQIPELLALLDVAVISSSNLHGSPMKLMEFMAMNRPVVAPDLSPIREVVEDGHTGRLFRFGDMDDMRRLVVELLEDREAAQEMGRRAREFVLTHLTWTEHARTVLETLGREKILSTIGESH
jgi:glycosyltransferase involved in cell wall biosynthesis